MTVDRNTKGGNKMSKKFLKMSIVLGMGFALMMGNMSVYAASSSEKAWRVWKSPSDPDINKVAEDKRNWVDESWEKYVEVRFDCDGMEYACVGMVGFKDGFNTNYDYMERVGGVSAGMKAGGRVYNASGNNAPTGWAYDGKLSKKASIVNTGKNVKYKFTVATKGY